MCAHLGLTPQSVHALGGWRVQARSDEAVERLLADARALADAGAAMLVLELVPAHVASRVQAALPIPVIGIGAGPGCAGQVLVLHDLLGLNPRPAKFVRNFMADAPSGIGDAVSRFVRAVKDGSFPDLNLHTHQ